jgi:DNA recombination protein RmuC
MDAWTAAAVGLVVGLLIGGICGAAVAARPLLRRQARTAADLEGERTRATTLAAEVRSRDEQIHAQRELLRDARAELSDAFGALGAKALAANNEQFLVLARKAFDDLLGRAQGESEKQRLAVDALVKPIREVLDRQQAVLADIERKREVAYRGLEEQIRAIAASHDRLGTETRRLVTALKRPEQRGRWGEMQLRNVVELAGMTEHCDFDEQKVHEGDEGRARPDLVVKMPGGGVIAVDAKVALDAYLDAVHADGDDRRSALARHAQQVQSHVRKLAQKAYWNQLSRSPKLVVMFMPLESALGAALDVHPDLHEEAMRKSVLIATPTLLVALLRAVAYGWQQEDVAANARAISEVGRTLYDRIGTFVEHFGEVGANLDRAARAYNGAVGSLEARLLASARELKRLHATTEAEIDAPTPIDIEVRGV